MSQRQLCRQGDNESGHLYVAVICILLLFIFWTEVHPKGCIIKQKKPFAQGRRPETTTHSAWQKLGLGLIQFLTNYYKSASPDP